MNLHKINLRVPYATLLQLEYVLAITTSYLLGARQWLDFFISLALCLLLGFVTTAFYWMLIDKANKSTG